MGFVQIMYEFMRRDTIFYQLFKRSPTLLTLRTPASAVNNNPLVQILSSGNQNAVGQVLLGLAQWLNGINTQTMQVAVDRECERVRGCEDDRNLSVLGGASVASVAATLLGEEAQPSVSEV